MTVGELKKQLDEFPDDMLVLTHPPEGTGFDCIGIEEIEVTQSYDPDWWEGTWEKSEKGKGRRALEVYTKDD